MNKKMQHDKVLHLDERFLSSEGRLTEPPKEGPDLVPSPNHISSEGKVKDSSDTKQVSGAESFAVAKPMPVNRDGEPLFMQTTAERGHAYIFGESGLDRATGRQFVKNNIEAAQANLDKLKKKQPAIGTSIAKYNREMALWQQKLDEAQQALDYWNEVGNIQRGIEA